MHTSTPRLWRQAIPMAVVAAFLLALLALFVGAANEDVTVYYEDFEGAEVNWTVYHEEQGSGSLVCEDEWHPDTTSARTGTTSYSNAPYTQSGGDPCLNYLQSPAISLPADVISLTVEFWHHHSTEECCDFGIVQVSTDGSSWNTISPNYSGLSSGGPGIFVVENVDVDDSFYVVGGQLYIRFRFLSDQLASDLGWFIDDIKLSGTRVDNPPTPGPSPTPSPTPEPPPDPEVDHGFEFSPITIVDAQRDVAEPSLRIDPHYNVYACGPFGASRAAEYAQKSFDEGDTFRVLGTPPEGRIATGGGGDCELAVATEPNANGEYTLSYTGLEALLNFSTSYSEDAGRSWVGHSLGVLDTAVDRQWMEASDNNEVYLGFNSVGIGYRVAKSTDGGFTYGPPVTGATILTRPGPIRIDTDESHNPLYNPLTPNLSDEIIYFTYTSNGDGVYVARSYDDGQTWSQHKVASVDNPSQLFSALAIDTDGNLYAAWTETGSYDLYYAFSLRPTGGAGGAGDVWSERRLVNRNPVRSTVMPWIEAGAPGRIAVTYYGSQADGNIQLGSFDGYWHVYLSSSFNALDPVDANGRVPFGLTQVTTHPIHWDSICTSGLGCSIPPEGDRTLLDFFQNRIAPDGGVHVVYNQSNKIPGDTFGRVAIVSYSKQTSGPSMFGGTLPLDPREPQRNVSTDPVGDAGFPISAFGPPPPIVYDLDALDITNVQLLPDATAPEPGTFKITLTLDDLSTAALNQALADQTAGGSAAQSLLYVVRWFSGTEAYSAVAKWTPAGGWTFGFNDLSFATVVGSKLEVYPGDDAPLTGSISGNDITMVVPPSLFEALDLPATPSGPPTIRPAMAGDTIYSVTAMTFGNANAVPESQEYLNQIDATAPFDFLMSPVPTAVGGSRSAQTFGGDALTPFAVTSFWPLAGVLLLLLTVGASLVISYQRRQKDN